MHDVVVVGSGPTGLMLAGELALAGVDVLVLEQRPTAELAGSRAGGLHPRSLELLDQRGIVDRFLAEGTPAQVMTFGTTSLSLEGFPTSFPYSLALFQNHTERLLRDWVTSLGVQIHHGVSVTGLSPSSTGVAVETAEGPPVDTKWLVGADGGRSTVRRAAGIGFDGWDATRSTLIAEVEVTEETPTAPRVDETGIHGLHVLENGHTRRVVVTERAVETGASPSLDELAAALRQVFGTDFGVHSPTWLSRFTDATRQATAYRSGRVLVAGDAAHVHSPAGGQGLGLGLQDAVNLGWKLAAVLRGAPETLLDSYHDERHPAGARALRYTMAQTLLQKQSGQTSALAALLGEVLAVPDAARLVAGLVSGLDVHYDMGPGHPLVGRRVPDLPLGTAAGPVRLFELLHPARPLLLSFGPELPLPALAATYDGAWELPVIGEVEPPHAVLVRPDGHVAWVSTDGTASGLAEAAERWSVALLG